MIEAGNQNMKMQEKHSRVSTHSLKGQMKKQNRND